MAALATAEDYVARYGEVDDGVLTRLDALLEDASAMIRVEAGEVDDPDGVWAANARSVACQVVHRVLDRTMEGVTQVSQGVGSYSGAVTFSNPDGAMYLTRADRTRLGIVDGTVTTAVMC